MRILVTRPEREAQAFVKALAARHHEALLAPVLRFEPLPVPDGLAERLAVAQAILLTSGNGARALAEATKIRGYRILAVGDATAEAARLAGFTDVASAGGDAQALTALATSRLKPDGGPLIHVGGAVKAGDIAGSLRAAGFSVSDVALYDMNDVDALPDDVVQAIEDGRVDIATFFSPRTARAFVKVAQHIGVAQHLARTAAVAISPAALAGADGIPWRTRIAARAPTQESVIAALEAVTPLPTGSPTMSDDKRPDAADTPAAGRTDAVDSSDDFRAPPSGISETAAPVAPRRGVGVVGAFVTGLVAAVVVLGGATAAYVAKPEMFRHLVQPAATDPGRTPVSREALAAALKPLDVRLAALETKTRALDAAAAQADALKAVQDKLAAQETRLATLQALAARVDALSAGGNPDAGTRAAADLAQARQELEALRAELATLKSRQETAENTLRALSSQPPAPGAGTATGTGDADTGRRIAMLIERMDRLEKREAQVSGTLTGAVDSAALARAIGDAEARVRDLLARNTAEIDRTRDAAAKLGDRLGAVEKDVAARLDAVHRDIAARGDSDRRAAEKDRAAAAIGIAVRLRQAIDAGGPFAADADLLKPLAAGDPAVAAIQRELAPFASAGVTTRRELARQFPEMARRVLAADVADDSWGERLLGKLRQLVSIRRVGDDARGATPEAILARAEAAMDAGDVARAVKEMKAMKSPAADPARDWLARAEAHLAALSAADRLGLHGIGLLSRVESK